MDEVRLTARNLLVKFISATSLFLKFCCLGNKLPNEFTNGAIRSTASTSWQLPADPSELSRISRQIETYVSRDETYLFDSKLLDRRVVVHHQDVDAEEDKQQRGFIPVKNETVYWKDASIKTIVKMASSIIPPLPRCMQPMEMDARD